MERRGLCWTYDIGCELMSRSMVEDVTWPATIKCMLPNSVCDPMYPSFDSSFEVIERDRKGGRTDRGIESRIEEDAGEERWRYGEARRTRRVSIPKGNQVTKVLSIIQLPDPFVHLLFYRVGGEGYRTNSRVVFGGGGCGEIVAGNFA